MSRLLLGLDIGSSFIKATLAEAFGGLRACARLEPDPVTAPRYRDACQRWLEELRGRIPGA